MANNAFITVNRHLITCRPVWRLLLCTAGGHVTASCSCTEESVLPCSPQTGQRCVLDTSLCCRCYVYLGFGHTSAWVVKRFGKQTARSEWSVSAGGMLQSSLPGRGGWGGHDFHRQFYKAQLSRRELGPVKHQNITCTFPVNKHHMETGSGFAANCKKTSVQIQVKYVLNLICLIDTEPEVVAPLFLYMHQQSAFLQLQEVGETSSKPSIRKQGTFSSQSHRSHKRETHELRNQDMKNLYSLTSRVLFSSFCYLSERK